MKIVSLLPVLAQAQDDTSTLLSLKVHTSLESGVDHLLDAVGSRNVTQMASLLQNLVEESISDGLGELDGDVKAALKLIKEELLGDIRDSLKEAHCFSQVNLHERILCFEKCEKGKIEGAKSCGERCDGMEHKKCRDVLFGYYKEHIMKCRDLDHFVLTAITPCPPHYDKGCCYLPHTTWNCQGPCKNTIKHLKVDDAIGHWMQKQISIFESTYTQWEKLYHECRASYRTYVEHDAKCDCLQAECETRNCEWDSCHRINCEDTYQRCWGGCEAEICKQYPPEQCKEKDRKIDWSATEKIECYVDVLAANPTKKELLDSCGSETCINKWREEMYLKCNSLCPEVDFDAGVISDFPKWGSDEVGGSYADAECTIVHPDGGKWAAGTMDYPCVDVISDLIDKMGEHRRRSGPEADEDVAKEGVQAVTTKHRGKGEDRCTAHLDLDWQKPPCCTPCEKRDSPPCEGGGDYTGGWDKTKYMWIYYGQWGFLDDSDIFGFDYDKCYESAGEHTYSYAYNLCKCIDCPEPCPLPCPTCTERKGCEATCHSKTYDYSKHYPAREAKCENRDDEFRKGFRQGTQKLTKNIHKSNKAPVDE